MSSPPVAGYLAGLDRFIHVPAEFARYDIDVDRAAGILAVDRGRLLELADGGLPHADDPDRGPLFDYVDLANLGMVGGSSGQSVAELAVRFILRFAQSTPDTWYQSRDWVVRVRPPEPSAVDGVAPTVTVCPPDLTAPGVEQLDGLSGVDVEPPGYQVSVRITGSPDTVRDGVAVSIYTDLLDALRTGAVTYQTVPEALRMRHREAWRLGMADCVVVSRLLAERLRHAGFAARARRGYVLGLIGSDHAWCEVLEDDTWKSLDPVFARLTDADSAFADACRGSRFNRFLPCVVAEAGALVLVDGEPAAPWALGGISSQLRRTDG